MNYENYCKVEGLEMSPAEKKAYETGQHDVVQAIANCFGISTSLEDEKKFLYRLQKAADMEIEI